MSNFDFLDNQPQFKTFYKSAVDAEKALSISPTLSVIGCRRSMECATKWIYRAEPACAGKIPIPETLINLMNGDCYRNLLDDDLYDSLHLLRRYANQAAHSSDEAMRDEGIASLWVLFQYYDWIDQFYGSGEGGGTFSQDKIESLHEKSVELVIEQERFSLPKIELPSIPDVNVTSWVLSAKDAVNRAGENAGVGLQRTRQALGSAYDTACSTAERVASYGYDAVVSALKVTMDTALTVPEITAETWNRITQRGPIQRAKYIRPKADERTTRILESRRDGGYDDEVW